MVGNIGIGIANAIGFKSKGGGGNISYPGLISAWSAKGKSNDDKDRAILKDLTGNGHDINLKGFAFNGMSGYGGNIPYNIHMSGQFSPTSTYKVNKNKITISYNGIGKFHETPLSPNNKSKAYKIKITGLNEDLYIGFKDAGSSNISFKKDGIYDIPEIVNNNDYTMYPGFAISKGMVSCNITFEILPEYPDALVFDGVDDYGINENMPILTDYTVIVKRIFSLGATISKSKTIGQGAFIMEVREQGKTYSFGYDSLFTINQNPIVYQSKNNYNGKVIQASNSYDCNVLYLGCVRPMVHYSKGAFYSAYLFDRSLDEQEIKSFIRKYIDPEYLLPSEQYLVLNQGKLNINKLK